MPTTSIAGLRIVADASLQRREGGRVLLGGSPWKVMRVSERGARVVDALLDGTPVSESRSVQSLVRRLLDAGLVQPQPERCEYTAEDVTVVIPTRGQLAPGLLDAIGDVHQIIVVDDASPEPTLAPSTNAHGVGITVVRRSEQVGPGGARNTGLLLTNDPLVAFLDSDCIPSPGWLEPLLLQLADPAVAAVAPRIIAVEDEVDGGRLARYERRRAALDRGPEAGRVRARTRVPYVPSAALLVRRDITLLHNGFDSTMWFGEDVDLVWRLDEAGLVVRYEPSSTVAHHHRTHPREWARRRYQYGTSAGRLARKHPGALAPVDASGWSLGAFALLLAGHPLASAALVGGTTTTLARRLSHLDEPLPIAAELATKGHVSIAGALARCLVRPWWPITLLVSLFVRSWRLRLVLFVAAIAPSLLDWWRERPDVDPASWVALTLADDISYSAGVWVGSVQARTLDPILPDVTNWPNPSRYSRWRRMRRFGE
jgi:mycofactocin glycosyltransferase